jgi:hypothetical protein
MELIECRNIDGRTVNINPDYISYIEWNDVGITDTEPTTAHVWMASGHDIILTSEAADTLSEHAVRKVYA